MQKSNLYLATAFQDISSVFHLIFLAFRDIWDDLWTALVINLVWTVCVFLIIPGPPATLALFNYANRLVHGEVADLADFFTGFRHHWAPAWRWGIVNLILGSILVGDILLTRRVPNVFAGTLLMQSFYITATIIWILLQLYVLPLMIEQEKPIVKMAYRNSIVMLSKNILFSVLLALVILVTFIIGTFLCMVSFAIGGILLADIGNRAVNNRLNQLS